MIRGMIRGHIKMVMFLLGGLSVFIIQAIGIVVAFFLVSRDDRTLAAPRPNWQPNFSPKKIIKKTRTESLEHALTPRSYRSVYPSKWKYGGLQ